ncbi:MAG: hypothetical protein IPK75_12860 [Acidobacteria bacterium]|nr:hypothetical protein [Acidobacteriota bacterium]
MAKATYPAAWGLTALESAYLNALRPGGLVSIAAFTALHSKSVPPARVRKTLQAVRRKLDPLNVEIETKWGQGWQIGQAGRARLTGILKG